MRIVVIGAVAAGTSAAAKARRNDDQAEIVIYEKDQDISYSGCGLPYYIGGEIEAIEELTPRDARFFKKKYDIEVKTLHEVLEIYPEQKSLLVKDLSTGSVFADTYDKLVFATGAIPFVPRVEGIDSEHVFCLRNVQNAIAIKHFIDVKKPKHAVIAGTGFIGFEVLENLMHQNIEVTIVEVANKITPNLDQDMAMFLEKTLVQKGIKIIKSQSIAKIEAEQITLNGGNTLKADLVVMATGVRPNTVLATTIGIELGKTGAIKVDKQMKTNVSDIYACGDCIETYSAITNKPVYRPLGSTANKTGRIAGDALTGGLLEYQGNLSTGIFKLFDLTIASTGLSEKEARDEGYDIEISHNIKPDKPSYFHGEEMVIKAIADRASQRLLGVQIIGTTGVDKRIDVFATLITYKAKVEELFHLDLAYAPPFSTTKDPVHYTGMILDNAINRGRKIITSEEVCSGETAYQIIDARSLEDFETKGHVKGAIHIPHAELRVALKKLDPEKPTVTYCNKGVTGNAAQNILINKGFKSVFNLSGGHKFYKGSGHNE
ncbi:FAD-dependent oxidoreductase [Fusibacter sp. 3D3]|uniref:FAD-dependent oxidoreductase n=1 Tax=Fusibacter sp. 3D3 TaxID=1048380 RepID=UPI000852E6DA|nr:FAD-dependent oxidoreductase [Fusibacter sp. 3D3]GAU76521.1 pyridine nucleotide-disulfide oxidoreductase [Fusibacter sp. 3D3]